MKRVWVPVYAVVFLLAFMLGFYAAGRAEYRCELEPYIIREKTESGLVQQEKGGTVNINTATASELTTLYGVGEKLAERIVDYRNKNGAFEVIEDILKVPGIGEKKLEKLRGFIYVE